jgi:peptidoglycan/xylan/chitin deacetylase (PgdA/CDA1 family)
MIVVPPSIRRDLTLAASAVLGLEALRRGWISAPLQESLPLGLGSATAFLAPTLIRKCAWFGPVTSHFKTDQREVWITIDDGPDPIDTPEVLAVLKHHHAIATFFAIGSKVVATPHLAEAVVSAGHSLQTHTYSHPAWSFWAATPQRARREIRDGIRSIENAVGIAPHQFRSPVGLSNPFVHSETSKLGLEMVGWSIAALDGIRHCPNQVVHHVLSNVKPGVILLLHEGPVPKMKPGTRANTLHRILEGLASMGFKTVIPPPRALRENHTTVSANSVRK